MEIASIVKITRINKLKLEMKELEFQPVSGFKIFCAEMSRDRTRIETGLNRIWAKLDRIWTECFAKKNRFHSDV